MDEGFYIYRILERIRNILGEVPRVLVIPLVAIILLITIPIITLLDVIERIDRE